MVTKYIGTSNAAHTPFIAPNDCPKLNILVTPWPVAFTCSTTTATSSFVFMFFY